MIQNGFEPKLVDDWLKVRKTKKATNTATALNDFLNEISKKECDKNEMLKICIIKNWSGFKHQWVENLKIQENGVNNNKKSIGNQTGQYTTPYQRPPSRSIQTITPADISDYFEKQENAFGVFSE